MPAEKKAEEEENFSRRTNIKTEKKSRPLLMHRATFLKEIIKNKKGSKLNEMFK